MVKEVNADTLAQVLKNWEAVKAKDGYEKDVGTTLFVNLFQKCPKAKVMFGYDLEADLESSELLSSEKFVAHTNQITSMLDSAFHMLDADGALVTEQLSELGEKHVKYGVQAEMFPIFTKALIIALKEELGDGFTDDDEAAWNAVVGTIAKDLMKTVLKNGLAKKAGQ